MHTIEKKLIDRISDLSRPNKYVKDFQAPKEVVPDLVLISPRHLFRMPYSLHEKTALASVVIEPEEIADFQPKDASPLKVKIKNFMPNSEKDEARELLMQALDWNRESINPEKDNLQRDFKPIKISNLSEQNFPPCAKKILQGINDGKKRALFVLINLFRSVGMEKEEIEKRIEEWNKKNEVPLHEGYIRSQLSWSFRKKPIMPPNCAEFYKGIGMCSPDNFCSRIKNPVNYIFRKSHQSKSNENIQKKEDNFKNNS